jgi:hypothetical protein
VSRAQALLQVQASKPRFDGSLLGWRIAPFKVLQGAGLSGRGLSRSCPPYEVGAETPSALDFTIGYLPADLKLGSLSEPDKWLCGDEALSVFYSFRAQSPLGATEIWFERSIQSRKSLELDVADDSVEATIVRSHPAIVVHPADDATGLGTGHVIVIEAASGPVFTIFHITADNGVPFAELVKIAEGIR